MALLQGGVIQDMLGMPGFGPYDPYGRKGGLMSMAQGASGGLSEAPAPAPMQGQGPGPGDAPQGSGGSLLDIYKKSYAENSKSGGFLEDLSAIGESGATTFAEMGMALGQARKAKEEMARRDAASRVLMAAPTLEEGVAAIAQAGGTLDPDILVDIDKANTLRRNQELDQYKTGEEYLQRVEGIKAANANPIWKINPETGQEEPFYPQDGELKPMAGHGFGPTRTQQQMSELDMAERKSFNTKASERLDVLGNRTQAIDTLERVIDLIPEKGGVGSLAEREAQADALRLLGVPIPEGFFNQDQASRMQAVDAAVNDYVAILVESMKGNPSDADLMLQFKRAPSGNNTREANKAIVNGARRALELEKYRWQYGMDYLNNPDPETGSLGRPSDFHKGWGEELEPVIKEELWEKYPAYQPKKEPATSPLVPRQPSPFAPAAGGF